MIRCQDARLGVQGYALRPYDGLEHHLLVCRQRASESGAQLPRRVAVWKSLCRVYISRCMCARSYERGEEVAFVGCCQDNV